VPAGDRGIAAHARVLRGEQGGVRGVPRHHSARGRAVDRRGLSRCGWAASDRGCARRDRAASAVRGSRAGWAADHGWCREDQVPREGGEWRGQARRSPRCATGQRVGFPPSPAGRAALGSRARDGYQAPQSGDHDRRRGRPTRGAGAHLDARSGRSARSAGDRRRRRTSMPWRSRLWIASPGGCARPVG
jgi:hypothetical protein